MARRLLRPGWRSVICLAPMCCKRARTKLGACLTPGHRQWIARAYQHVEDSPACDRALYGDRCTVCEQIAKDTGP